MSVLKKKVGSWKLKESRRLRSQKMLTNVVCCLVIPRFCGQQNCGDDVKGRGISEESASDSHR